MADADSVEFTESAAHRIVDAVREWEAMPIGPLAKRRRWPLSRKTTAGGFLHCAASNSTTQTASKFGTTLKLAFDTTDSDVDNPVMHDAVTNNSRITINTAGSWAVIASIAMSTDTNPVLGYFNLKFLKNNVTFATSTAALVYGGGSINNHATVKIVEISPGAIAGDYFEVAVEDQDSGGTSNMTIASGAQFFAYRVL